MDKEDPTGQILCAEELMKRMEMKHLKTLPHTVTLGTPRLSGQKTEDGQELLHLLLSHQHLDEEVC